MPAASWALTYKYTFLQQIFLSIFYVSDIVLGNDDSEVNERDKDLCPSGVSVTAWSRVNIINKNNIIFF